MSVTRYTLTGSDRGVELALDGKWTTYEEHQQELAAQAELLREVVEAMVSAEYYIRADAISLATAHGVSEWEKVAPAAAQIVGRLATTRAKIKGGV